MLRRNRRQRTTQLDPTPEYRPALSDGENGHQRAHERIIGIAAVPGATDIVPCGPALLTRGQAARTAHPEIGVDE
ncbi:hypothetical protein ABT235_25955 [Micromonospora echinofusca]|uniref:hypothetical protein n=1 Tax=Micromonospora echinofusca TaxID=47858 RepID=UPI00332508B6